jgi:imidazole glycerol-phosphate synthase subunit HisH
LIAIIDYDIGNLAAVANMLHRLGGACEITSDYERIEQADKIILPGNGAFDACIRNLRATGLVSLLEHKILIEKTPLLGICVGAQMLGKSSEEGVEQGLGWIDMCVKKFPDIPNLRVPHMGWNSVSTKLRDHPLLRGVDDDTRFYFVHSYYMSLDHPNDLLLETEYGIQFAAAVAHGNIAGVQFHPEKSHRFGKQLLSRFLEWD